VIDVSNPTAPVELGSVRPSSSYVEGVDVVGGLAYVADASSGLRVIDVSDPAAPVELGALAMPSSARDVEVVGGLAYVAAAGSGLRVIDVSDPAALFGAGRPPSPATSRSWAGPLRRQRLRPHHRLRPEYISSVMTDWTTTAMEDRSTAALGARRGQRVPTMLPGGSRVRFLWQTTFRCASKPGRGPSGPRVGVQPGPAHGECLDPANGQVLCKTKRGKHVNILLPDGKVQRALDKGFTLGECGAP
jgi:hypothetical protein